MKNYLLLGLFLLGSCAQASMMVAMIMANTFSVGGRASFTSYPLPQINPFIVTPGSRLYLPPDNAPKLRSIIEPGTYNCTAHSRKGDSLQYRITLESDTK